MQKAIKHILAVLSRVIVIGLGLQIILGLWWIAYNLGSFQKFGDSLFYIEVSKSMVCDENTGIIYPVLLMLARGIEGILRIPYTYVMQLLQLVIGCYAGYYFCQTIGVRTRWGKIGASLAVLTFPMIAQCHLAILPNSLNFSVFLLELALVLEAIREQQPLMHHHLFGINMCWLISALLLPEYLYLGALPVLLLLLYDLVKYRRQIGRRFVYNVILIAAFVGMMVGVNMLVQDKGVYGKPAGTWEAAFFRRVAWTSLCEYYDEWPQEMQEACSYDIIEETAKFPDYMELLLQPQLESTVGVEKAQTLYWEAGRYVCDKNFSKILHEIVWDVVGYTLPPIATRMMLTGRGYDSCVGRNYEVMRRETPVLSKYYLDYSCWWFVVGLGITIIAELGLLLLRRKINIVPAVLCLLSAGSLVVWYTLQGAGMWDYKNALFTGAMWILWSVTAVNRCEGEQTGINPER